MGNMNSDSMDKIPNNGGRHEPHHTSVKHTSTSSPSDSKSTIVVLVFAEWCGHCKSLKPKWEKMKNTLIHNHHFSEKQIIQIEDINPKKHEIIQKIDSSIRVEDFKGYPTIFKKTSKGVEFYHGSQNAQELINWVLAKSSHGGFQYKTPVQRTHKNRRSKSKSKSRTRSKSSISMNKHKK
jgi:thiol-disulfide isomerase/thioredoxin